MVNPVRGQATCTLTDDTQLTLVIDFDALAHAEDAANMGVNELLAALQDNPRMKVLRAIVFGALQSHHSGMTMADVGNLLLSEDSQIISEALGKAVSGAFAPKSGGAENPPSPPSGAGTTSKPTGRRKG